MDFMSNPAPNMSDEASTTISGKRRLRRSCESCRNSKGKCVPSEQSGRCQRCVKEGQHCTFLEAKPRPKRAKNSRTRVAEMEEKLDGLMALLASKQTGKEASPSGSSSAPSQPSTAVSPPETGLQAIIYPISSSVSSVSFSRSDEVRPQQSQQPFSLPNFDQFNDVISKGLISSAQAEKSVRYFQSRASRFPFVLVPPKWTLESLRRERPFLLLSMLSFSAHHNEKLQLRLESELRESLSKKVIVHCEKSLDLIQGVLAYLAWYHFYFEPNREQIYQLTQMAAAMAIDLGIQKPTPDSAPKDLMLLENRLFLPKSPEELEAQRTFLGVYFLSTTICQGLRKPNSLKYSDYMETCAESLARAALAETDYLLPYYIRFQRLAEEVDHAFDYSQNLKLPQLDTMRVEILLKSFEQQLNQVELTFPAHVWNNPSMTMKFYNLRIYVNEVGLHATKSSEMEMLSSFYYSSTRNEILIRCLRNTKEYLDRYLLLTTADLGNLNMTDYISLVYAILVLGAFATGACDSPTLDIANLKQTANLEYYLDALSAQALQLLAVSEPGSNNFISHIYNLFQQSKVWYAQMEKDPTPIGPIGLIAGRPTFSFMEIIPTIMARCVDFSVTFASEGSSVVGGSGGSGGSGLSEVGSDEQWSEMLSSWAASQDLSNMVLDTALG